MNRKLRIVIATSNAHKVREISQIVDDPAIEIVGLDDYPDVRMPDETGETFSENARLKAQSVCSQTGQVTLADDSGLCVDALQGEPGVRSNRFLGPDASAAERNLAILRLLAQEKRDTRRARFACAACIAFPDGSLIETLESCEGEIAERPAGEGGFGYDPIFYLPEYGKTMAEVSPEIKNEISHRGKAIRAALARL